MGALWHSFAQLRYVIALQHAQQGRSKHSAQHHIKFAPWRRQGRAIPSATLRS
jgi:hypothetical protein